MIRNASRALKIGVHLPFDPNFDVGIGTFDAQSEDGANCLKLLLVGPWK